MFIFYHEFDSVSSGAAVIIVNLIRGLLEKKQKVLLLAKVGGALHNSLKDTDTSELTIFNCDRKSIQSVSEKIQHTDTIITFHYYSVYRYFGINNPKIIFYAINITSLPVANLFFGKLNFKWLTRKLIRRTAKQGGLLFMDEFAKDENEKQLEVLIKAPEYLPLPVVVPDDNIWLKNRSKTENLAFTYVGRAVDWKIFPVRKLLKDIQEVELVQENLTFYIVTDNQEDFKKGLADIETENVTIIYKENLLQEELNTFLLEKSLLHFAMGTSALDGAKLGIPTVLLDFSYEDFPDNYKYNFLFMAEKFSVGGRAIKGKSYTGYSIQELIKQIQNTAEVENISRKCYEHVKENHALPLIVDCLVSYSSKCQVHLRDISSLLIRYWR